MNESITNSEWDTFGDIHNGMNWTEHFKLNELRVDNLRLMVDGAKGYFYDTPNESISREEHEHLLNITCELVDVIDRLRDSEKVNLWYQRYERRNQSCKEKVRM